MLEASGFETPTAGSYDDPPSASITSSDIFTGPRVPASTPAPEIGNPFTSTSSSLSYIQSSALVTTLADSAPTSTSSTAPTDTTEMNGLIAGIVVLAALFLAMTGILIWTIRRKRCKMDIRALARS